jgi:D-xylose transport system permease protein
MSANENTVQNTLPASGISGALERVRANFRLTGMEKKLASTVVALVLIMLVFQVMTDGIFLEPRNFSNLLRQTAINGILAVGMTWVILLAGVDLSVGSVTALIGIVVAIAQTRWGWGSSGFPGLVTTAALALAIGLAIGAFNALWISGLGIHSFVVTFGMMVIARGFAMIISNGQSISPMGPMLNEIGAGYIGNAASGLLLLGTALVWVSYTIWDEYQGRLRKTGRETWRVAIKVVTIAVLFPAFWLVCRSYNGLPIPVLIFGIIAFAGSWILNRTRFGRYVYAVGGNAEAARLAGIPVKGVIFAVFTTISSLAALSGVVLTARLNGATPNAGQLFELDAIAAVVIGGTSLKGGKGSVIGSLVGALIIESLNNGMSLMNVPTFYQMPLKGAIVILAVAIDSVVEKRKDV